MNAQVSSANDSLKGYFGSDLIFIHPIYKIKYTEGIRQIAIKYDSFWFLDIIASYQNDLKNQKFQRWKLERDYAYTLANDVKFVVQRKDSFNIVCEDGNGKILIEQKIPFSEFRFDEYTIWFIDGVIILPVEY